MKILHLAPHLGGGVGKAHASMAPHMPTDIEQTFALLYEPIDCRHVNALRRAGSYVVAPAGQYEIESLANDADIVQYEFWGHPKLDALIASWVPPRLKAKTVTWCHVSGLPPIEIPFWALKVDRFVATSPVTLPVIAPWHNDVIGSGFGFEAVIARKSRRDLPRVMYLGTVDFKKMHPDFFAAVDSITWPVGACVGVWGNVGEDAKAARMSMRNMERIALCGHTDDPMTALAAGDIFFYPLRRDHYGTAENALIEAMSLGLVPVVLDNPAEASIVTNGKDGFVAKSMSHAVEGVKMLMRHPGLLDDMSRNSVKAASRYSPKKSADQFVSLWRQLIA